MENFKPNAGSAGSGIVPFSEKGNLSPDQAGVLSEDLATFLVAHYVLVSKSSSLKAIIKYFSSAPGLTEVAEDVLFGLKKKASLRSMEIWLA